MKTALGTVLITDDEIRRRITELGRQISKDYASGAVTFVGILKGSFVFLADLIRQENETAFEYADEGDGT